MLDRREFLVSAAVATLLPVNGVASAALAPGGATAIASNVADYLQPFVERQDFSGFVLLARGGETLVSQGFGFADFEARTPNTADTRFMTASIGKMFTRAAILALSAQGRLSTSDAVARFLPGFPNAGAITVQNLIDHRGGVARDLPPRTGLHVDRSLDELVAIIAAQPAVGKPGEGSGYSNNGYRLLAKIIEVVGRGSYDALVRELVFEPRSMRDTMSGVELDKVSRRAIGYRPGAGWSAIEREPAVSLSNERGAGSFYVTANDMMRFLRTLPLEHSDLEAAPRIDAEGKPRARSVGHDGFGAGFANLAYAYPDEKAAMVLLGNVQSGLFMPLHGDLRRMLFGERVAPPTIPAPDGITPDSSWDAFTGDYDLRPGNPVVIRRTAQGLTVDGGEGAHPLNPIGPNSFFMRLRYATLRFEDVRDGKAQMLRWAEGGGEFPLKRLA